MIEQDIKTYVLHYPGGFEEQWTPQPGATKASKITVALELLDDAGVSFGIALREFEDIEEFLHSGGPTDEGIATDGGSDSSTSSEDEKPEQEVAEKATDDDASPYDEDEHAIQDE